MTELNILVVTDKNYIPLTNVMLTSLFENNMDCAINIHLMHSSLVDDDLAEVDRVVSKYEGGFHSYR
jgi:lipopolysaccharide biosynthesis glycosyltransferase